MIRKEVGAAFSGKISLTLSMGLTAFDKDPTSSIYDQFEVFLKKVDRALAEAKEKGNTLITSKKLS